MKFLILLMTSILVCSCANSSCLKSDQDRLSDQLINAYAKIAAKKGLSIAGVGGGVKEGKINLFKLSFDSNDIFYINNARKLSVESFDEFLELVNRDKEIRPFLVNYPFQSENISFSIVSRVVYSSDKTQVAFVSIHQGIVRYYGFNYENPNGSYPLLLQETLEEARNILAKESQSIP